MANGKSNPVESGDIEAGASRQDQPESTTGGRFPKSHGWMNGRSVFWRPESRASVVAERDIIQGESEQLQISQTRVEAALARRGLGVTDLEDELREVRAMAERRSKGTDILANEEE